MGDTIREKCSSCGIQLFASTPEPKYCVACRSYDLNKIQYLVIANGSFKHLNSSSSAYRVDDGSITAAYSRAYNQESMAPKPVLWAPPSAFQRRKALLCGVTYRSRSYELEGTINDVMCMKFFLVKRLGFRSDSIRVLKEDERDPSLIPTKRNIQEALQWLIKDCQPGDSLVFYFSGHGSQQPSILGDEIDGYDETICPLDYETRGMISDNEINATIVRPLPNGATLHAIIDACHSGTVLDLPFLCKINYAGNCDWEDHYPPPHDYKGTSGGLALCFSACNDDQSSADTSALSGGTMTGAMTYCFLKAAELAHGFMTYGELLTSMRSSIQEAIGKGYFRGPFSALFNKVRFKGINQVPQLSSTSIFDANKRKFIL